MDLEDLLLLAAVALAFSACMVVTQRLIRRFAGAARWRAPSLAGPW
jgi:hypothetical protein